MFIYKIIHNQLPLNLTMSLTSETVDACCPFCMDKIESWKHFLKCSDEFGDVQLQLQEDFNYIWEKYNLSQSDKSNPYKLSWIIRSDLKEDKICMKAPLPLKKWKMLTKEERAIPNIIKEITTSIFTTLYIRWKHRCKVKYS